jgi:hypothetical protein
VAVVGGSARVHEVKEERLLAVHHLMMMHVMKVQKRKECYRTTISNNFNDSIGDDKKKEDGKKKIQMLTTST